MLCSCLASYLSPLIPFSAPVMLVARVMAVTVCLTHVVLLCLGFAIISGNCSFSSSIHTLSTTLIFTHRIRERKESVTVLLCGTSGCGKSTLSALLVNIHSLHLYALY